MSPLKIIEDDLHAYVDGALTPSRRAEDETWLAECPEDAERVQAYLAQKQSFKELFN